MDDGEILHLTPYRVAFSNPVKPYPASLRVNSAHKDDRGVVSLRSIAETRFKIRSIRHAEGLSTNWDSEEFTQEHRLSVACTDMPARPITKIISIDIETEDGTVSEIHFPIQVK
ncbi:MAG: hypothetical protein Q8K78_16400 [Planctomycetaceae bacterium]|nr:hypothetical protein [Planctomycetaceae bacterium]